MKIIVSGNCVPSDLVAFINKNDHEIIHVPEPVSQKEMVNMIHDVDYYFLGGDEILNASIIQKAAKLKAISFIGTGANSFIDLEQAEKMNIHILTTPGMNSSAVAEFALAQALGIRRNIFFDLLKTSNNIPNRSGKELNDSNVGIIGMGHVGEKLARLLVSSFSCNITYHSRTRKNALEEEIGLRFAPLQELFSSSSTIFVTCSLTPDTEGLINKSLLSLGAEFLVSISDPRILDFEDFVNALESRSLTSCALDGNVWEAISHKDDLRCRLKKFNNSFLFITNHIAASSDRVWGLMEKAAVKNLIREIESEKKNV